MYGTKEFVRTADLGAKILRTLAHKVEDLGGNTKHLRRLTDETDLLDHLAEALVPVTISQQYQVLVNISKIEDFKSAPELRKDKSFEAVDWHKPSCVWGPLPPKKGIYQARLVEIRNGQKLNMSELVDEMARYELRPATALELLCFYKSNDDLFPMRSCVALGSTFRDGEVLYISSDNELRSYHRDLLLRPHEMNYFLAIER